MTRGKLVAICLVWLGLAAVLAATWKLWFAPSQKAAQEQAAQEQKRRRLEQGSSASRYAGEITIALDSFSGYAVLRSREFESLLGGKRIKLKLEDDAADYGKRLAALKSGDADLAAFTVDALIKASADLGDIPATIVAVIDETRGADAMLAYKQAIPNLDALNRPDTRFVLTPDSPSETLARVVMTHFKFDRLAADPFVRAADAADVFKRYRDSKPDTPQVFVLWEPYVSKILENTNTYVVVDSSRFHGYIVDVLVASRDFIAKNPDVVRDTVECYFRALFRHQADMVALVLADAKQSDTALSEEQAEKLVQGIWWKNTQENFAHFGLREEPLQHIEDMIANITSVLTSTKAIAEDPTGGKPNLLYFDTTLKLLHEGRFYPGTEPESVRDDIVELPVLTDEEWEKLRPVGTLEVPPLVFARGTANLSDYSRQVLDELVEKLKLWPQYYVLIRGNASRTGDLEANQQLAASRASAAAAYLMAQGVSENRVRALGGEPSGEISVSFQLGEQPY